MNDLAGLIAAQINAALAMGCRHATEIWINTPLYARITPPPEYVETPLGRLHVIAKRMSAAVVIPLDAATPHLPLVCRTCQTTVAVLEGVSFMQHRSGSDVPVYCAACWNGP